MGIETEPTAAYNRAHRALRLHTFDHTRVAGSRIGGLWFLLAVRALMFSYALFVWVFSLVRDARAGTGNVHFAYFTNLCYTGLVAYLAASLYHTVRAIRQRSTASFSDMWPVFQLMHWLLYGSVAVFSVIVTGVYWSMLYPSAHNMSGRDTWINASVHAMNTGFFVVEAVVGGMVLTSHWSHPCVLVAVGFMYVMLAYVNEAVNGFFTYDFLNYKEKKGVEAAYIFGLLAALFIIYYVVWALQRLLDRMLPVKSHCAQAGNDSEYQQVECSSPPMERV
ncbi:hypothetical protein DL89DRAFT_267719 [Linderina pennispora]|uniref:Uncharacterized protein n=1 Tax=Linderina pennispora TaxID=61395 RepID=A0A1Y1W7V1_9FUNG|nr:uncharacterized protein DL89DRAFT_267719 [Linderina pennispora]ORX69522.1 hypothetical protein DL89DRAFT_267719 [Linderina pennispora]